MKIPIIIDTDYGGDPDDAIALLYAVNSPELSIQAIFTADEYEENYRALSIQNSLQKDKINIPVYAGKDLGNRRLFFLEHLVNKRDKSQSLFHNPEVEKHLKSLAENEGIYVSIGGLSNINYLTQKFPSYFKSIKIYIMGGAINYRRPGVAEHNIRIDIDSARNIFNLPLSKKWLFSDLTFHPKNSISKTHILYKTVSSSSSFLAQAASKNMDEFYNNLYSDSYLHDPVLISSLFLPTVQYRETNLKMTENGEFKTVSRGKKQNISIVVDYDLFWKDLNIKLSHL